MRIEQVFSTLIGRHPTPGRTAGSPGGTSGGSSIEAILEAEIVQLSLNSDGIWQAATSAQSDTAYAQTSARHTPHPLQLASTGLRFYLHTGHLHVRIATVGLTVDTYV